LVKRLAKAGEALASAAHGKVSSRVVLSTKFKSLEFYYKKADARLISLKAKQRKSIAAYKKAHKAIIKHYMSGSELW
jgi:hypothetical protein